MRTEWNCASVDAGSGTPIRRISVLGHHLSRCASATLRSHSCGHARTIRYGDSVQVQCIGTVLNSGKNANLFKDDVCSFIVGQTQTSILLPAIGDQIIGLSYNESIQFTLDTGDPSHPQAVHDAAQVVTVPVGSVDVHVGMTVKIQYQGQSRMGTVVGVSECGKQATVDMNDPLAGEALELTVTILQLGSGVKPDQRITLDSIPEPLHVPDRMLRPSELQTFDGVTNVAVYISVCGFVYDVSTGSSFYGPHGAYGFMAGHDATVALAKFQLNPQLLDRPWTGLDEGELGTLLEYVRTFQSKYPVVGRLRQ
eukprot:m.233287 g.233287  ORF g.233287 m.233287 type:complete len:310 (-) comp19290_c0_seq5:382-1311(-)